MMCLLFVSAEEGGGVVERGGELVSHRRGKNKLNDINKDNASGAVSGAVNVSDKNNKDRELAILRSQHVSVIVLVVESCGGEK